MSHEPCVRRKSHMEFAAMPCGQSLVIGITCLEAELFRNQLRGRRRILTSKGKLLDWSYVALGIIVIVLMSA